MHRYLKAVFLIFLFVVFVLEGLGINNGRQVAYNLILLMPFFLFISQFISKGKKILFPVKFTFIFFLFMIFSLVSSVFSVNLQNSFQNLFLYTALFLVFIFVFNYKELVKNSVLYLIFALSFIFSFFSLFINFFAVQKSLSSIPLDVSSNYYQFVYSAWSHNHLGDFLLLPLIILIFRFIAGKFELENLLLFLFFIPYFIFSYSRSAYVDLILITLLILYFVFKSENKIKKRFTFYVLSFMFVVILTVFVFAVPTDTKKPAIFNSLNIILQQEHDLSEKKFFAGRNLYATEGLFSFADKPLFGVGPGNFGYASGKYMAAPTDYSDTSHNLFFEVFIENGVLAGIIFLLIIFEIFASIKMQLSKYELNHLNKNNVLYIFLFLAMLFNFQTDYTYLIHSFFLLFFVLIGLIYQEQKTIVANRLVLSLSLALFIIFNLILISNISFVKQDYKLAFYTYPPNKNVYQPLINEEIKNGNTKAAFKYLNYYMRLFNGDVDSLTYAGNIYYQYVGKKDALPYYERAFNVNNFESVELVKRIYQIRLGTQGKQNANEFADRYFLRLSKAGSMNSSYNQMYYRYRLSAFNFCKEVYKNNCPYHI